MVNQAIWIGIAVGVFFAGLGIGYAVFQSSPSNTMLARQQMMTQMMSDPQTMNEWMNQMMNNPQAMNQWMGTMMNNQQFIQQMHDTMMNNPQHMQTMATMMGPNMMGYMMNNPQMNQQMMNTMMQNNQFMQGMMMNPQFQQNWMGPWMMNNTNWRGTMNQGMMGPGMMGGNMMMGQMMGTPITKETDVLKTIDKIETLLDQVSAKYRSGDSTGALATATEAYLENYEYIEGAVAKKDQNLMQKVELMLRRDLRHDINTGQSAEEIDSTIDSIKKELGNIKALF
jgi:hypothetical protein